MKKSLIVLTVLLSLFALSTVSYAASGKAIIPYFHAETTTGINYTKFYISNITNNPINVKVTLFSKDGIVFKNVGSLIYTGVNLENLNTNLSDASLSYTLDSNKTSEIMFTHITLEFGYGFIEWTQDSDSVYGLVAMAREIQNPCRYFSKNPVFSHFPINNGLPF